MEQELVMIEEQEARRFYDRLRRAVVGWTNDRLGFLGQGLVSLLLAAPDLFMLIWRLQQRTELSRKNRLLLAFAVGYFILPADLLPDWVLGPLGFTDDLVLAVAVLKAVLLETPAEILQAEWSGNAGLIAMLSGAARLTDRLLSRPLFRPLRRLIGWLLR